MAMGMDAWAQVCYGVVLHRSLQYREICDAVGGDVDEPNEEGVVYLRTGEWSDNILAFNQSVDCVMDGTKEVNLEKLGSFDTAFAEAAINNVLAKLGQKPAKPKWLLIACYF